MNCVFCKSKNHISHNCDTFTTTETRKSAIASSRGICASCLTFNNGAAWCGYCQTNRRCFMCFTADHHVAFCDKRNSMLPIIFPRLDYPIFSRFIELLPLLEKYSLAYNVPAVLPWMKLKQLQAVEQLDFLNNNCNTRIQGSNVVVLTEFNMNYCASDEIFDRVTNEELFIRATVVRLFNSSISKENFYRTLNPNCKELLCERLKISENVIFEEVLQKLPSVQYLRLFETNANISTSWPRILLDWNGNEKLAELHLSVNSLNFSLEDLARFISTKVTPNFNLVLWISDESMDVLSYEEQDGRIRQRLGKYFKSQFKYNNTYGHKSIRIYIARDSSTDGLKSWRYSSLFYA